MENHSPQQITSSCWVVIPTYNEKDNVTNLIKALINLNIDNLKILIVDDNSPDGTAQIVREQMKINANLELIVRPGKSGLGRAYVHGFTYALQHGADHIVQIDADFSHDPHDVPRLLAALTTHDLALGSRYSHGISVINWPLTRLLTSIGGNIYVRLITNMPFKDATGGFKAWRAQTLTDIKLDSVDADGYGFQIITTYRAWRAKKKIIEVPIIFTERRVGQSKMSYKIVREAVWIVWRLRFLGK